MAAVTIVMTGDDARLQAAHERLFRAQEKALENYQKSVQKSKEAQAQAEADAAARKAAAEAERARLEAVAKGQKIIEGNMTAQERYNAAVAEAEQLAKDQIISETDLARRKEILAKRLFEESGEAKKAAKAEAELTDAHRKAAEVIKAIQTPMEKYNAKVRELTELQKKGALSAEQYARAEKMAKEEMAKENDALKGKNELLASATQGITAYVAGLGSATAAIGLLRAGWQQVNDEQRKGLDALKATQDANRNLLQVSDNAEQFRQLRQESDALAMETGVDRVAVREVMFQGVSEGFKDAVPDIIRANQVIPVKEAAGVAGKIPALFQGQLGPMEAVDLTLAAAKASPLDFGPIAQALPAAAEGGSIAKASPEETIATLSVLATRFKSGETAADRIKAFAAVAGIDQGSKTAEQRKAEADRVAAAQKELRTKEEAVADIQRRMAKPGVTKEAKEELEIKLSRAQRDVQEFDRTRLEMPADREAFAGKGILQVAKELQAMSAADRQKFLGSSQELNAAYTIIVEEMPKIEKQVAELVKERQSFNQGGGILRNQMAIARDDAETSALRMEAIAQRQVETARAVADGSAGAIASGATALAEANLINQPLATRAVGARVSGVAANVAAEFGADQTTAAAIATAVSLKLTELLEFNLRTVGLSAGQDLNKITQAANTNLEAAKINKEAAERRQAESLAPSARAQAATAGR